VSEDNLFGGDAVQPPTTSEGDLFGGNEAVSGTAAQPPPTTGGELLSANDLLATSAAQPATASNELFSLHDVLGTSAVQPPSATGLDDCQRSDCQRSDFQRSDDEAAFDSPGLLIADADQWPLADLDCEPSDEPPSWLTDEFLDDAEAEHAAWLAALPEDIREDFEAGPYTGAGETIPPGFTHRDPGGPSGAGFASGGALDQLAPGPWLASALARATADGYDRLTDSEQVGVLLGWQRQACWAQAGLVAAVSGVRNRRLSESTRPGWSRVADHITDEVAIALRLTSLSAGRLLGVAAGLDRLPPVAAALSAGQIDWAKACLLAGELAVLTDEQALDIATRLLRHAGDQTTGQLRAALARAILAADPHAAERRKQEGRKDTRVEVWREPSGNAVVAGRELRPADAIAADAQLTADARWLRTRGMPGTLAELRAAAYVARLSGRELSSMLPGADSNADHPGSTGTASNGAATNGTASNSTATNGTASNSTASNGTGNDHPASQRGATGHPANGHSASGHPASGPTANGNASDVCGSASGQPSSGSQPADRISATGSTNDDLRSGGPAGPPSGSINLTMPLSAFAGLTDSPGEVAGHGVVDAATGRELAALLADTARWCLTLTDADGRAVAHACARRGHRPHRVDRPDWPHRPEPGDSASAIRWAVGLRDRMQYLETGTCSHSRRTASYTPPASLRHLVEIRQRTCFAPGCRRPATHCDIDHTVPFDQGGMTCDCNTAPGCRRHHRCKQLPGWHVTQGQPGVMTWRLPGGRSYVTTGDPYPV
jgi:hypothetical protein